MAHFAIHPKPGSTIKAEEVAEHYQKIASNIDRVQSGYNLTTLPNSLTAYLVSGVAFINGYQVGTGLETDDTVTLVSNTVNYIYLDSTGLVIVNQTGILPGNSIQLWTVTTNGSGVTVKVDARYTAMGVDAAFRAKSFKATDVTDPRLEGGSMWLEATVPFLRFKDAAGNIRRIRLSAGKLEVTNDAGTALTPDLADVIKGVDTASTDAVKDKMVSNLLAKGWQDHLAAGSDIHSQYLLKAGGAMTGNIAMGDKSLTAVNAITMKSPVLMGLNGQNGTFTYETATTTGTYSRQIGQIKTVTDGNSVTTFWYDSNNDYRVSKVEVAVTGLATETIIYTYDATNMTGFTRTVA